MRCLNMAIKCLKCGYVEGGASGLHMFSKCPKCGNTDPNNIIRVDDADIDSGKHKKEKEYLESRKIK